MPRTVVRNNRRMAKEKQAGKPAKQPKGKPAKKPKGKRRLSVWVGSTLIVVGLSLLAYVAWQFWGTNWVSHRKQDEIVKKWETGDSPVLTVAEGDVGAVIRIPEFGDDYVVPVLEGTSKKVLAAGYGHFEDSADPGEIGNYALAGHRVTHGEPLRRMPDLEVGDEVIVETRHAIYHYTLISGGEDLRVTFRAGWVIDPLPKNPKAGGVQPDQKEGQRLLTLTTCAELFHTDDRLIAFAELTSTETK